MYTALYTFYVILNTLTQLATVIFIYLYKRCILTTVQKQESSKNKVYQINTFVLIIAQLMPLK